MASRRRNCREWSPIHPDEVEPYWRRPAPEAKYLWRDGGEPSHRGLMCYDPLASTVEGYVTDVELALAPAFGYPAVRVVTTPLRGLLQAWNRRRVAAANR